MSSAVHYTTVIFVLASVGSGHTARALSVDSPPASGLYEARSVSYRNTSDEAIIVSFIKWFYTPRNFEGRGCTLDSSAWEGDKNEDRAGYIAAAGAVLYVLANHVHFSQRYPIETNRLLRCGESDTSTTTQQKIDAIRMDIHKAMSEDIRRMGRVGTDYGPDGIDADFDMALHGLAHLMYLFQDDPVSLPTDIIFRILCMGDECRDPPDHFHKWGGSGGFLLFDLNSSGKNPYNYYTVMHQEVRPNAETENHVLSIYLWNYLATNLVIKFGENNPNPGDDRYHADIRRWYLDYGDQVLYQPSVFYGDMLRILGRVMHNGFFEHNSRPYQKYSISGILTAAIYGFLPGVPDELYEYMMKVRQAARNAIGYAAVSFAFQALRGKRSSPWRRKIEEPYRTRLDFYASNLGSVIFGLMSGAREWNACSDDEPECRQLNYRTIQTKSWVLWPSLARHNARRNNSPDVGYELPEPIHGLMFDGGPFFSRMQTRFTEGIYQRNHYMKPYFVSDYDTYLPGDESWESTPELYFRTADLMLAAGGQWERYYEDRVFKGYNVIARPTMLFGRGDFGHRFNSNLQDTITDGWLWREDHEHAMGDALQNVMLVPGKRSDFFESTCNVWVYRNFNYGYRYHDVPHLAPGDWYEGYPQRTPDWWDGYLEEEFSVQTHRDRFQIYEFPAGVLGDGTGKYYVIRSRIYKETAEKGHLRHSEFRRGFTEIVPGHMFSSASEVKDELLRWNRPEFDYLPTEASTIAIPDAEGTRYNYRYVLVSSNERLKLNARMGSDPGGLEGCRRGIVRIERPRVLNPLPALSNNDWYWEEVDLEEALLPRDYDDDDNRRDMPLITAWELNERYQGTGRRLVEVARHGTNETCHAKGELRQGHLLIRRPVWTDYQIMDTLTYRARTWQCLELDSHSYRDPRERYIPMAASYEECSGDPISALPIRAITAGGQHSCALRVDGTAWCWGDHTSDQLGVPWAIDHSAVPVQVIEELEPGLVTPMQDVVSISAGATHSCAVRGDTTVWCWGSNEWGQLGIPTPISQSNAARVVVDVLGGGEPLSGVEQVSAGFAHTCVVQRKEGMRQVLCWGANFTGQLGYSIGQGHYWPELVPDLPEAEKVSSGYFHTCIVGVDGSVWCWGNNSEGQLGHGTMTRWSAPQQVQGAAGPGTAAFSDVIDVSAGGLHTCAIKYEGAGVFEGEGPDPDNSVWCWGWNPSGQIGDGTTVSRRSAIRVYRTVGGYAPVDIAAGGTHTCALLGSGETLCWGENGSGQLGDGTNTDRSVPTLVSGFVGRDVAAGGLHSCAIEGESLWCWGENQQGQLGVGHTTDRSLPYMVLWQ